MAHQILSRTRIKSSSDLGAGALLSGCSALFLFLGKDLERGTAFQMGPGFFPTAIGTLAFIVGLALIAKSLGASGPATEPFRLAPAVFVIAAIASFALLIGKLGLILTGTVTMALASLATVQQSWLRVLSTSVAVSVFSGLLFVIALGLSIPLWPVF
jgi:uncharacterized membrane protein YhhN